MKKITYATEPKLKIHKYVVQIIKNGRAGYWYCLTLKEVKQRIKNISHGSVVEVFRADHKFIQAYYKPERS